MAVVGRLELDHPPLNDPGGSALHAKVETLWTAVSNHIPGRFFTAIALADTASVDFKHNFQVDFADLSFTLYEYNDGTGDLVGQLSAGFSIIATPSFEKTTVRVTNNSGGVKTIALVVNFSGAGSAGGGGGSLSWREPSGIAPLKTEENLEQVYLYEAGLTNKLTAFVKIPEGHVASNQITMKIGIYSPDTSGTLLLKSTSTLIRTGTDAISSTTNQHVSTNAAETLTAPADKFMEVVLDLTDGSGLVNGVAAEAGDLLKVELYRGTDTSLSDGRFVPNATGVSF